MKTKRELRNGTLGEKPRADMNFILERNESSSTVVKGSDVPAQAAGRAVPTAGSECVSQPLSHGFLKEA